MKTKTISFLLIILAGSLVYPVGSSLASTTPVASNDSYVMAQNTILDIHIPGILANDTATTGKTLTAGLVADVKNGTLLLNPNGSFIYVPDTNFYGVDSFKYASSDGTLSSIGTVTITVQQTNHVPIARNDSYFVNENSTLTVNGMGILGNDTNLGGGTLSAILVSNVINGQLTLNQNGSFAYKSNPNFHGADSFMYKASNSIGSSNVVIVTIQVNSISLPVDNPIMKLFAQIQILFSKITGMENEITDLKNQNANLESRVHQLEINIHNNSSNTGIFNPGTHENEQDDDQKISSNAQNGNQGSGEHGRDHSNKQKQHDNQDD